VSVRALERIEKLSDHAPILLTTGTPRPLCKRPFKFELGWLQRECRTPGSKLYRDVMCISHASNE
jgi:hypothetical protein